MTGLLNPFMHPDIYSISSPNMILGKFSMPSNRDPISAQCYYIQHMPKQDISLQRPETTSCYMHIPCRREAVG